MADDLALELPDPRLIVSYRDLIREFEDAAEELYPFPFATKEATSGTA